MLLSLVDFNVCMNICICDNDRFAGWPLKLRDPITGESLLLWIPLKILFVISHTHSALSYCFSIMA